MRFELFRTVYLRFRLVRPKSSDRLLWQASAIPRGSQGLGQRTSYWLYEPISVLRPCFRQRTSKFNVFLLSPAGFREMKRSQVLRLGYEEAFLS